VFFLTSPFIERDYRQLASKRGDRLYHLTARFLAQHATGPDADVNIRYCLLTGRIYGACSAAKFVVKGAGEEYDAAEIEPNRKSRTNTNGEYTC
jgi:hypothetical protein